MQTIFTVLLILGTFNVSFAKEGLDQYFSFMGFTLEDSTISDVIEKLGATVIHKEGDAADSYTGVCYYSPENRVTLFFESGEMGGGVTLLGYKIIQNFESKYPCREVSGISKESLKLGNLRIGENLETAIKSLPPNIKSRDNLAFFYHKRIPFTKEEIRKLKVKDLAYAFWDQSVTIQIFSSKNQVTGYSVYKVTSW